MKYKLNEISDISSSKRIYAREYVDYGIPFYRGKEIIEKADNKSVSNKLFISVDRYNEIQKKFSDAPKPDDILVTSVGTIGRCYFVKKTDIPFYFKDGNLIKISNYNKGIVNPEYLYYLLISHYGQNKIMNIQIGSTQQAITIKELSDLVIDLPTLQIQDNIVNELKTVERNIELNIQINDNLDDILTTIFEKYVNRNTYKQGSLTDIANYKNGLAMQKFRPQEDENSLPVLKIKELNQGSTDDSSDRCSANIDPSVIVHTGDIVFSWSGTLLVKNWTGNKAGLNQHLFKVTSDKYPKWFIYEWTKYHLREFQSIAAGKATTMGHIKRSDLKSATVFIPDQETMSKLDKELTPIYNKRIQIIKESKKLNGIKNTLLEQYF